MTARSVTIIGGGFTGACVAIQLLGLARTPLDIRIIEPRESLGEGIAYASPHRDHRLNGPASSHSVLPDDLQHLVRWCHGDGLPARDPEAVCGESLFIRRHDFARYVQETLQAAVASARTGSTLRHLRDEAASLGRSGDGYRVTTVASGALDSRMVVVATGNPGRGVPRVLDALQDSPALVADPYDASRLAQVARDARVLVVGSGLTAMDVVCTLVRQRHAGPLVLLSRRGLVPRSHPRRYGAPGAPDRLQPALPAYTLEGAPSVRAWLAGLRRAIADRAGEGGEWHEAFDELRDVVWQLWPRLPVREQERFQRHLRTWYDAHRFRVPGPTQAIVQDAAGRGQLSFEKGRIESARRAGSSAWLQIGRGTERQFDVVVNATGFEAGATPTFIGRAIEAGLLVPAPAGAGVDVDLDCRALDAQGMAQPFLRVLGPPTAGRFGDPLGTAFIRAHIARVVPGMLESLAAPVAPTS